MGRKQTPAPKIRKLERKGQEISLVSVGGLEQPIRSGPFLDKMIDQVNLHFKVALETKDIRPILQLADDLSHASQALGLGLARTFWLLQKHWRELYFGEGDFEDEVYLQFGKDPLTVQRYIGAWNVIENAPDEIADDLKTRPIQDLIAVSQHENAHGVLAPVQLQEISRQPDTISVRKVLQKIRGDPENGMLQFVLKKDGTLEAWMGGNVTTVGFIRRDLVDLRDPLRRTAVNSIVSRARIQVDGILTSAIPKKGKK